MVDLFPSAEADELQERSRQRALFLLSEIQETLSNIHTLPHLAKLEQIKKEVADIDARIENLKQKIS